MQVLKLKSSGATDVMKSEGNNSVDTFIRQAIGKEPFLSFSRTGDSPIQWIQLLHALDQQDLPGWPLLSPVKVQMQKCEKCSREFCSTINYRRHNRLHRRTLNLDKDSSTKNRDCLKVYWDKLSTDETMTVVSFQDVTLEGVAGSSIIKALSSFIRKPGFSSLPPAYVKAGAVLLDVVQGRPSRFPLTSQELFSILDDASENTFLCAGMAESLQKYVFDGEVGKVGLEMRNLVACTSFLIEQKLVKAWLADKDAEALRCQKLLVEEEEAAQRRQAEILERKRQKKLRQKEQKAKAQACEDTADFPAEESADTSDSGAPSPPSLNPLEPSDSSLEGFDLLDSPREQYQMVNVEQTANDELHPEMDRGFSENGCDNDLSKTFGKGRRTYSANVRWHSTRFQKEQNGFHPTENSQAAKHGGVQKQGYSRDSRNLAVTNTNKVWTPKPRCGMDAESCATKLNGEQITAVTNQKKAREVLIGTISVAIGNCASNQNQVLEDRHCGSSTEEPPTPKCSSVQEKLVKSDIMSQGNTHRQVVKLWRPVSRHKNRAGQNSVLNAENNSADMNVIACSGINEAPTTSVDCSNGTSEGDSHPSTEGRHFSSSEAEAFLAQRWKEAVAADHVKLVLLPETPRPPGCTGDTILVTNQENSGIAKPPKNKRHTEKGSEVRYIPKQRNTG